MSALIFVWAAQPMLALPARLVQDGDRTTYEAPDLSVCDPSTPKGSDARADFIAPKAGAAIEPPWAAVEVRAWMNPADVIAQLDLARCLISFYIDMNDREGLMRGRDAVARAAALMRDAIARDGPGSPSVKPGQPLRAGVDVPLTRKTRDASAEFGSATPLSGLVFLDATIGEDGRVRRADVIGSLRGGDDPAAKAVGKWRFEPTLIEGKAVEVVRRVLFRFGETRDTNPVDGIDVARFDYWHGERLAAADVLAVTLRTLDQGPHTSWWSSNRPPAPKVGFGAAIARLDDLKDAGNVKMPTVQHEAKPEYTPAAMTAKLEGEVRLEIVILPDGTVGDVLVRRSLDPMTGLDASAVETAKGWRFRPAIGPTGPVPVVADLVISFFLR